MKKTKLSTESITVEIITEQVSKKTFDGVRYEIIHWAVYTDTEGTYHTIPNGQLYYEEEEFNNEEITYYHNKFIKSFLEKEVLQVDGDLPF